MRRGLLALGAGLLTACFGARTPVRVPASTLPLAERPPPPPPAPAEGVFEAPSSRPITFVARSGGREVTLSAYCRVGVWTTLQEIGARTFVARESWGRLGERRPKRLRQVEDQVLGGVIVRLRPDEDGAVAFVAEVAEAHVGARMPVGIYHGERVTLGAPHRHGYVFVGRAPPGWSGAVARWGDVTCTLGGEGEPPRAVRFAAKGESGFVVGAAPRAETFVETWTPAEPIHVKADGVERMDFRLVRARKAAGFLPDRTTYGAEFRFE